MAQELEPGDLIEIFRTGYKHWAVYVGDGFIVHLTGASDVLRACAKCVCCVPNKMAMVKKEKLEDVAGNDKWKINNKLDKKYQSRSLINIVKEANARVGEVMNYNVLMKNCEHFANDLRYGKPESRQAALAAAGAGVVGFLGTAVLVAAAVVGAVAQNR